MLKANFNITETGGTGTVQLQSSSDQGVSWQPVGTSLTLSQGALTVDDSADIVIDTSVFIPGQTYDFRLVDMSGSPISSMQQYTIHTVSAYTAGVSTIGFASAGGDSWTVDFYITPTSIQAPSGVTLDHYEIRVIFWSAGASTPIEDSTHTADYSMTISGHGAGVYDISCGYIMSDGSGFSINRLTKVDASGSILADVGVYGFTITDQSGLQFTETASMVQTGVSYTVGFAGLDAGGNGGEMLASTNPATFTIQPGNVLIAAGFNLDATFSDFTGDFFPNHSVTVI